MTGRILRMPRLGETMEEGRIVGWLIKAGDSFKRGDSILEIETDKTIAEFPALGDGRLEEFLVSIGDMVEVGTPLARIDIGAGPDWTAGEGEDDAAAGLVETDLAMPRLGETMEEGRIAKWLKSPGDRFARGEAILEIETDKTIAEFPALGDGRLVSILHGEDETVAVGEPIARIETSAGSAGDAAPVQRTDPETAAPVAAMPRAETGLAGNQRARATPLARRLARRHGLDIAAMSGTGRRGRIEKADVVAAAKGAGSARATAAGDVGFANLPRGRMAYLDSGPGTGRPFLLLHGFSGDRTTWAALAAGLRRAGRRVLVPDLPGHGLTEIEASNTADLSPDLPAFLDAVDAAEVHVVAHSLGAIAALGLAARPESRVRAIDLIAPAGLGSEIDQQFVRGMAGARTGGEVAHLLRRLSVNGIDLSETALEAIAADLARGRLAALCDSTAGPFGQKVDALAVIDRLSATMPIRVLFGLEDRIIPWRQALTLPPGVPVHFLARSGHMPQWDQTRDVLDILLSQGGRP